MGALNSQTSIKMPFHSLRLLDAGVGGHIVGHPDVAADDGVVADGDAAQDAGITVDGDIVLDDGMSGYIEHIAVGVFLEALRTQRHTLVERHMVADDGRLTNDHARTVVDGEVFTYLCARMDVDARL